MRKVLHKVKSQWVVLGVLGATVVSLGTADVRQVSASEIEGASASETLAARELGTADVSVDAAEKTAHVGLDHAISTATTDGTATVFVHWNEDGTISVTVKDLNDSVLYSELLVDSEGENTIKVLTANQDYYTIKIAVKTAATEETTTATEQANSELQSELAATEEIAAEENDYAKIVSTTEVDYPAVIARTTDAINTAPWGVQGYQTLASSADYAGKTVDVTKEQVTDYGVTWALVSLNGKELGWIAKDALTVQTYAAITSETVVDYPAIISRGTDAINLAPWGTKGYQTIASSAAYVGQTVEVIKEQTTDYGVTWVQISLNGEVLGWIAKDALAVQTYAAVVSETMVDYPATVNRDSDAINTAPWGVKGYKTLSSSAAYAGQTVEVKKEQVTDYGVTWAQISLNGEVLGWIAKDALKVQTYSQITKETAVDYAATISRDSDAINTAPWGVKGYQTLSSSAAYVGKTVEVTKEQITDYGVTWAQISLNGEVLGWIAKDALKVQTYAQITKETAVSYDAIVNRDSDAINTAPWGVKGYQTLSSSATYVGQTVEVIKEQITDYGVTWALVSQDGKELGWIAKDALKVQIYAQITKETTVSYDAIVNRDSDAINTAPWGVKGYQTLSSSAAYVGQTVEVTKEQTTDYGVTWALVSQNGKELGWIAKDALKVQTYAQIVSENEVAYPALINRGTDAINTAPWGTKGYQTNASSADYLGQTVEVTKEQTTDYGVTWSLVSLNGKELGWIAKDALIVLERTIVTVVAKENTVAFQTVTEEDNTIPTGESQVAQVGVDGYDTVTYDVTYVNGVETNRVEVSRTTTAPVNKIIKVGTQVTEVKSETTTGNEVDFTTVEEEDNTIPIGERVVVQAGVNGYDTVTYDVTYVNGVETNRVEADRTTTAPVNEIIKVGTQVTEAKSETTTENEVDFTTVEEFDNTITTGERVVVQAGVKGYDTVSYDVTYVNGIETNRVEISRATTAPVLEIVKVGTQVTEVKSETTTGNEVAFATVEEEDNTIPTGERVVAQTGAKGYDTVMFDVTYVNGIETNRVEVSRETTAPVSEIVKVGTQVTEVKSETTTETEVDFTTIEEFDNTIPTGERIVVQTGVKGFDTVTYDVTYVNDLETNRVEVSRETTAPVSEIVKVGTQITEVKSETTTEKTVGFTTVEEFDDTIPTGESVVVQIGLKGYDTVTYNVTYVNGVETNRVEADRTTTVPVNEIVKVGTQVTEVKSEITTEKEVAYSTTEEFDNTIPTGERVVAQTGVNGFDSVTYAVTFVNGIETNRVEVTRTTTAPVAEIVKVGTQVTEVKSEITTENEVAYATIEEFDNMIPTGERVVDQAGVQGYDTVTYDVTYVNGIETNRVEVSRATTAPVSEIVKVGTQVTEIKTETANEKEADFTTVEEFDNTIPTGERVVVQAGVKGYDTVSYDVTYVNGIETNRVEVSRVTTAPVAEVIKVGTQVTEVKSETNIENEVTFTTVEEEDNTIPTGERVVVQAGEKGYDTVTYNVTYVNGVETNRVEVSRTTAAPVNEIVKVGTQVTEVKFETITENEVVYVTVEEFDNTIPTGERVVVQAGGNGYDTVIYDVTYVNGIETNRVEASRTTTAPMNEIVKVGTQVTEIRSETVNEYEAVFTTVEEDDNTIPAGERVVVQDGVNGYDMVTYEVTYVNGVETSRVEVSRATTAPISEIVKVGTQVTEVRSETTIENEVSFTTIEDEDNTIPTGERVVVQAGVSGYDTVTYNVTYVNGIETNRVEVGRTMTTPVSEIVKVGTQVTEVKSETSIENEVAYSTVEEEDNTIPTGERIVVKEGADGLDIVTYDVTYVNGFEMIRVETSRTTTAPVAQIVKVGTQVTEVKSETTTENELVFTTIEEEDNTIPTGERIVVQEGTNGYDSVTYDVTYINGVETNRIEINRTTYAQVNEIIKVGTLVPIVSINMNKTTTTLKTGDTEILTAQISPNNATIQTIIWKSSNESVASVDITGRVTAVGLGTATITATTEYGDKFASCNVIVSTIVGFKDRNLERAIRQTLNKPTGNIYRSDVEKIDSLYLDYSINYNNPIDDLSGIENLTNLTSFTLNGTYLYDISPLGNLVSLQNLNLQGNRIYDINSLRSLTNLTSLNISFNSVNNISVLEGLINLEELNMQSNSIYDITSISNLGNLQQLNLSNNSIQNLENLTNLINLNSLNVSNASVQNIDSLSVLTSLEQLYLSNNRITDISALGNLTELSTLFLNNNQISDISALSGLANLQRLDLSNNYIGDVSPLNGLMSLQNVNLYNNMINVINVSYLSLNKYVSTLAVGETEHLIASINPTDATYPTIIWKSSDESVATVDASGKITALKEGIAEIKAIAPFGGQSAYINLTVSSLVTFKDINLENSIRNHINKPEGKLYKSDVDKLTGLRADYLAIQDLSGIENLTNLNWLSLYGNRLIDLTPLKELNNLTYLELGYNKITDINVLSGLVNLEKLHLDGNQISDLTPLSSLTFLHELAITSNKITDIRPIVALNNLEALHLSLNQISDLTPLIDNNLISLKTLNLNDNQISDLSVFNDPGTLKGLSNLENLYLNSNQIVNIEVLSDISSLGGFSKLKLLNLNHNQISSLSGINKLVGLTSVDLSRNQIVDISLLSELINLQTLYLNNNQITDAHLLSNLPNLQTLELDENQIDDSNMFKDFTNVMYLYLRYNKIVDVEGFIGLTNLKYLLLTGNRDMSHYPFTVFSASDRTRLIEALPDCVIYFY